MKTMPILLLILATAFPGTEAKVGGRTAPDGTEIQIDLPGSQHAENISVKGLGCCVFRSIDHAARWAALPALIRFPEWMKEQGIAGGGWPAKVDELIPRIAKARNLPVPAYIQVQNSKDLELIKAATKSGRMVSVTYSRSPTGRYNGQRIAHMVNAAHFDEKHVAVLDNNYPGDTKYEWMTPDEFMRVSNPAGFWAVILLTHGPPAPPRN